MHDGSQSHTEHFTGDGNGNVYVVNINHVHVEQFHYPPRLGYAAQSWEDFGIGSEKTTLTTNGHGQGVSNNSVSGYISNQRMMILMMNLQGILVLVLHH